MSKIKLELWLRTIIGYLVILVALFSWAWLQDKVINALLILMAYASTRWIYPTTYHAKTSGGCLSFSIACFCIAITISLPINLSIISSILIGATISALLFIIAVVIELISINNELIREQKHCDLYSMNEDTLRQYGASKGLSEIQLDILIYKIIDHYTIKEICEYRNYGRSTIKYHISEIKKKLDIDKL